MDANAIDTRIIDTSLGIATPISLFGEGQEVLTLSPEDAASRIWKQWQICRILSAEVNLDRSPGSKSCGNGHS